MLLCGCSQIHGHVEQNGQKMPKPELRGTWDGQITAELPDGSSVQLWQKAALPADPTRLVSLAALPILTAGCLTEGTQFWCSILAIPRTCSVICT